MHFLRYLLVSCIVSVSLTVASARPVDRDMVPDEETAKRVGGAILQTYIGKQAFEEALKKADITVLDDGKAWVIFLYPKPPPAPKTPAGRVQEIVIPHGIGLPELHLSKHDATVTEISFSRD